MLEFQISDDNALVHIATQNNTHTQKMIVLMKQCVPFRHVIQYQLLNGVCCISMYDSLTNTLDYYWTQTEYHTQLYNLNVQYIDHYFSDTLNEAV